MSPLTRVGVACALVALAFSSASCKKRVTPAQCDAIVERYAELVVKEKMPDASATEVTAERTREKSEAHGDDAFKNCATEVEPSDYDCAMRAATPDALEKCLE